MEVKQSANPLAGESKDESKKKKKYFGQLFVIIVMCLIFTEYYIVVFEVFFRKLFGKYITKYIILLSIFHILIFLLVWSLLVTMHTHPGEIPLYWGFYIGDEDYKRKRYCLICNSFKPERSHHCSVCNFCVLNMDHHCPWVNNCIGFYNRKYFMQLLLYVFLLTWYLNIILYPETLRIVTHLYINKMNSFSFGKDVIILLSYCIIFTISILITLFFRFHITIVLNNTTTIESLDPAYTDESKYTLTSWENWIQVFGENKLLWFFPIFHESGFPKGDGLTWKSAVTNHNQDHSDKEDGSNCKSDKKDNSNTKSMVAQQVHVGGSNVSHNFPNSNQNNNAHFNYESNNKLSTNPFSPQNADGNQNNPHTIKNDQVNRRNF